MAKMTTLEILTGIKNWVLGKFADLFTLIPYQASPSNQLADKAFVNSSIATATATFRGTFNVVTDLLLTPSATPAQIATALGTAVSTKDNNDYCFVQIPTSSSTPTEIARIDRYKYNGTAFSLEYTLNNSGFTAEQWAAINSGVTSGDMTKLRALPTSAELTTLLNGKQDVIQDLADIRSGASAGSTAVQPATLSSALSNTVAESGVFDLSAYNNGTTYADLNAALTALNALPDAYKKGGMSFKYVRSSDNKYVQYRFVLSTFTTAQFVKTSNWQGKDVSPIYNSPNLVESGGVYKGLAKTELHIDGTIDEGTIYNTLDSTYNRVCVFYPIFDADASYKLTVTYISGSTDLVTVLRSAATPYSDSQLVAIPRDGTEFTIPDAYKATAKYIGVNSRNANEAASFKVKLYRVDSIKEQVDDIKDLVSQLSSEGYTYKGIATSSTNPGTQLRKTFYIAKEAGTYTNFGSLVAPKGISVLKWDGTSWSLDNVAIFDDSLNNDSSNPVQNKAIYETTHQHDGELSLLKDAFGNSAKVFDLLSYHQTLGYISYSNNNKWSISGSVKHIVVPVSDFNVPRSKYIKIYAGDISVDYAWLSDYDFVIDEVASVISHSTISSNANATLKIPDTAAYLYFSINSISNYNLPDKLIQGEFSEIKDKADKGIVDIGTTYDKDNKTISNRIGNAYLIKNFDDIYHIELTDVVLDRTSQVDARIYVSLLKNREFTGSSASAVISNIIQDTVLDFVIGDAFKTGQYRYLGVYIYKSTDSIETQVNQSFHCKIYTKNSLTEALETCTKNASDISELNTRLNTAEAEISAIETAMTNVSVGQGGGNDCIFERRTILSTIPYYMSVPSSLVDYDSDQYIEQKIKKITDSKKSFIFITDTHLYKLTDHSDPSNARKSDLLMSYIRKRCHINTGIFGGDCYDNEPSKYLGASVLTEYASEFFSVFAENGLWAQGNHDNNFAATNATDPIPAADALVSDYEAYMRTVKTIEDRVVFDEVGLEILEDTCGNYGGVPLFPQAQWWFRMHYYKDDVNAKIRYIILESGDDSWANMGLGKDYGALWFQMDFVAMALNTIPEDYDAVIAFHMCGAGGRTSVPSFNYRYTSMIKLLSSYKTKSSVTLDVSLDSELASKDAYTKVRAFWQQMNVEAGGSAVDERTFNFSNHQGSGKVVCITGHFHNDAIFAGMTVNGTYGIHRVCEHNKADVPLYSNTDTYTSGDEVVYNNNIYVNSDAVDVAEEFDATKWIEMADKDNLPSDAVYMLWREQDAYASNYPVKSIKNASRTLNTITEQAFDVFTLEENSINIVKIGGGEDIELPI